MDIKETTFGPKKYLTLRKSIAISQITDKEMYDEAGSKLGVYMRANELRPSGPWSVLYFSWDEAAKKAEIGIAFPIDGLDSVDDPELSVVEIPESKAVMATLRGPYEGLGKTHQALGRYLSENELETDLPIMAIEEYIVDPMGEPDPEGWITNIYYLHV
jgi:effector-binding domain-containing protein